MLTDEVISRTGTKLQLKRSGRRRGRYFGFYVEWVKQIRTLGVGIKKFRGMLRGTFLLRKSEILRGQKITDRNRGRCSTR